MGMSDVLPTIGNVAGELQVRLSNQIIHLLSEQMYSSPLKAVEELVVNSYDADANECRISIPPEIIETRSIVVFDDGTGMDYDGLAQLWHVGQSPKRNLDFTPTKSRRVIGKFGIGKLATYAIADKITYLTRRNGTVYHVICDYRKFKSNPEGASEAVPLTVKEVNDPKVFRSEGEFTQICENIGVNPDDLTNGKKPTWTFCILEHLKPKAHDLRLGRLKWVLRTAMPLRIDFKVWVNKEQIESSKASATPIVQFEVADLPDNRIQQLNKKAADPTWHWRIEKGALISDQFPIGVRGSVIVSSKSLVQGKSADIERSHGFFVKVRDRLVAQKDESFGLHALTHQTFNFFRADISADDLNSEVTAPREGVENSGKTSALTAVLLEVFNEARSRHQAEQRRAEDAEKRKREHEREYVPTRLVERPIADTLSIYGPATVGPEADNGWFFINQPTSENLPKVITGLYDKRTKYKFEYISLGKTERFVKLDPLTSTFSLNQDHEIVNAYGDDPTARHLLEDIATCEVMLEVYMREAGLDPYAIGEVLERRDTLLRSISKDSIYSLAAIAQNLKDSIDDEYELEVALVGAARSLGFHAKHISKAGEPDGVARFNDFRSGEVIITLEAKSSQSVPSLSSIDFAGLAEHVSSYNANGCLLLAPSYPGETRKRKGEDGSDEGSAVENRASSLRISCWTITDLARVVAAAETHHINATQVLEIVLNRFKPADVKAAVDTLLSRSNMQVTYKEIINVLRKLFDKKKLPSTTRSVAHVSAALSVGSEIDDLGDDEVKAALIDMSKASRGILRVSDNGAIILSGDLDELERRIASLTGDPGQPRRAGTFRDADPTEQQ